MPLLKDKKQKKYNLFIQQWQQDKYLNIAFTRMKAVSFTLFVLSILMAETVQKVADPYKVLGVKREANSNEIKNAFRKRTLKYHPDRNSDPDSKDKYAKVVNAYQILKDKDRRRMYDMTGDDNPQQQGGGFGGGFGGFNQGGFINLEDLFGGFGGFGGGQGFGGQGFAGQGGRRRPTGQQFTFTFGGL